MIVNWTIFPRKRKGVFNMKKAERVRLEKKEWLLLAVSCAKDGSLSPAQLQKSLFLLGHEFSKEVGRGYYQFIPYNYGPFCKQIYLDAEILSFEGFINIFRLGIHEWTEYSITDKGFKRVNQFKGNVNSKAYSYLNAVVNWARSVTFQELISSIYSKFPEFKKNSVFLE